jgi:RNA polymerase sigma-70 factor (ECF subfamily)
MSAADEVIDAIAEQAVGVSDRALIDRWLTQGDRDALDHLLRRYLRPIRRYVFAMLLHDATADDVTQDVFLRAIKGLPTFAGRAEFSTWLFQIARNAVYSHWERHPAGRAESLSHHDDIHPAAQVGPEHLAIAAETIDRIETALGELTPKLRGAVVLVCLQDLSADRAAAIEGCEPATIYSRLHEARRQLKRELGDLL